MGKRPQLEVGAYKKQLKKKLSVASKTALNNRRKLMTLLNAKIYSNFEHPAACRVFSERNFARELLFIHRTPVKARFNIQLNSQP